LKGRDKPKFRGNGAREQVAVNNPDQKAEETSKNARELKAAKRRPSQLL